MYWIPLRGGTSTSNSFIDLTRSDLDLGKRSKENAGAKEGNFLSLCSHSTLKSDDNHQFYQHEHSDLSLYNLQAIQLFIAYFSDIFYHNSVRPLSNLIIVCHRDAHPMDNLSFISYQFVRVALRLHQMKLE